MVKKLRREGDASAGRPPKAAAPESTKSEKFKKKRRLVKAYPEKLKTKSLESAASAEASASAPAPETVGTSTPAAAATSNGVVTESNGEDSRKKEKMKRREETKEGEDSKPSRKEMTKGVEEQRKNRKEDNSRTTGKGKEKEKEKDGDKSGSGFIFMCNAKTKPECYRHGIFGLPRGKMDVVEKIRPGAKLFLYDFDLKLMYGVYKATTWGRMDLVRHAFDGKFPAQVKFSVDLDCLPVPESSFRNAIKENYDSKGRFTQELSSKQVHRLLALFKPISVSQSQPQQIEDIHHPHIVEDRRGSYLYGERRASQHVDARGGPFNVRASLIEDHHTMVPQAPVALRSHHVPLTRELPQVPPMYYHQVAPNSSYHQPVVHGRTAAEVTVRDPLVSRDYRALPGDLAARSERLDELYRSPLSRDYGALRGDLAARTERLDELYRPLVSRDYGALQGDLAARSERLDDLYRTYKHTTSTMGIHQQPSYVTPSYENPRSIYAENVQRPLLSTRVSGPSVPVSTRYSFAGPPAY